MRNEDRANVLIMGCAGIARYRSILEDVTGLPVVQPCQAAVSLTLSQIMLNISNKSGNKIHAG